MSCQVNLAVVALLPLAAYEAVLGMPTAALAYLNVSAAARRIFALTDAPTAVHEPQDPQPIPRPRPPDHGDNRRAFSQYPTANRMRSPASISI